jgi:ribonuclease HI
MEGNRGARIGSLVKANGSYTTSNEEIITELMSTHFPDCVKLDPLLNCVNIETPIYASSEEMKEIDAVINETSVEKAIKDFCGFKSPGGDGIFPALLQKGSEWITPKLTMLFRHSCDLNHIPEKWRETLVTFIPKQGKSTYDQPKSFRPISLMSFVLKTLEKVIDNSIKADELATNPIHARQHAYQKGKGTETALHQFTAETQENLNHGNVQISGFFDIAGAFDNTGHISIMRGMELKSIKKWKIKWTEAMLKQRKVQSSLFESTTQYNPRRGCPQGGILSPTLWCLVVDPLIAALEKTGVKVTAYADDLVISSNASKPLRDAPFTTMNKAMRVLENWCKENGLSVNPSKSNFIFFSKGKVKMPDRKIILFGGEVKRTNSIKYLGVMIDERLNWNLHFAYIGTKSNNSIWAARKMVAKHWGLSPKAMLWIYEAIIIPKMTYGAIVWWHKMNEANLRILKSVERRSLMLVTGAVTSTPNASLNAILNVTPIEKKVEEIAIKACARLMNNAQWRNKSDAKEGHVTIEAITKKLLDPMNNDSCEPVSNHSRLFRCTTNSKENWNWGNFITNNENCWYTDGSIRKENARQKAGVGFFNPVINERKSLSLSEGANITQAEIIAISVCAERIEKDKPIGREINILTDSLTAIRTIQQDVITTKTTKKCTEALNRLARKNRVKVIWCPAHNNNYDADIADKLAKAGTHKNSIDVIVPITNKTQEDILKQYVQESNLTEWKRNLNKYGNRNNYEFIRPFDSKEAMKITNLNRKNIRVVTGLLTGHCLLRNYLNKIGKTERITCRFCDDSQSVESYRHVLKHCPQLNLARAKFLGPTETQTVSDLLKFAKETKLYDTFFQVKD